jgi:hypothetical protein
MKQIIEPPMPDWDAIPDAMKQEKRWLLWRSMMVRNKRTGEWKRRKVPCSPITGKRASAQDRSIWLSLEEAQKLCKEGDYGGIGFALGDGWAGIDMDSCIDPKGRLGWGETKPGINLSPELAPDRIIETFEDEAYFEKSPSGNGLHGIMRLKGKLPPRRRKLSLSASDDVKKELACYDSGRFFTVTGRKIAGNCTMADVTDKLVRLHSLMFPQAPVPIRSAEAGSTVPVPALEDNDLIERASHAKDGDKFQRLWEGSHNGYPSQSEADLALCNILAFWTGRDEARIDQLFRQSGLMRDKWEREDYRDGTIARACESTVNTYSPHKARTEIVAHKNGATAPTIREAETPAVVNARNGNGSGAIAVLQEPDIGSAAEPPREDMGSAASVPEIPEQTELPATIPDRQNLPTITVKHRQLREKTADCLLALQNANRPPSLFVRNGKMVRVLKNEKARYVISGVDPYVLIGYLTRAANFLGRDQYRKDSFHPVDPPIEVARDILFALGPSDWGLPELLNVIEAPALRPDGSILDTPGYDSSTKLFYEPAKNLAVHVPENPTTDEISTAVECITEIFLDYPFADDKSSKANMLAGLLTPICRPAITGSTPLLLIGATIAGSGKTMLSEIIAIIATGSAAGLHSAPTDETEWRKTLTSILLEGTSVVVFDNIAHLLDSPVLCMALTAVTYSDRVLGISKSMAAAVNCSWIATGNNIQVGGDMPRRCYWVRIKPNDPNPSQRSDFKHAELKAWVTDNRSRLLSALLTIARAWFAAGKPIAKQRQFGGFQNWANTLGGILDHAKVEGFLENRHDVPDQSDVDTTQWESFLLGLHELFYGEPFLCGQIEDKLREKTYNLELQITEPTISATRLRNMLPDEIAYAADKPNTFVRKLGNHFSQRVGRMYGSQRIHIERESIVHHAQQWKIVGESGEFQK